MIIALLPLLFVLSGAAGLIYEVIWARQLVLVFGNTSQAVSTILTGFFGGLAIGGVLGGRLADRVRRPLRMYGLLELVLVVVVLLTPVSFRLLAELYRGAYPGLVDSPVALALVRFVLAVLALAPATVLMGATLPTLTRYLTSAGSGLAGAFTRLYAANTTGAIVGTFVAGFVLIEVFGLTGALVVGAACSGTAGGIAILLDRRVAPLQPGRSHPEPIRESWDTTRFPVEAARRRRQLALVLAFVSGLTSLGYQVVWNRLLSAGTGSSTYVFTIILTLFLIGIALGAMLFGSMRPRLRSPLLVIGVAQVITALLVAVGSLVLAQPASPFQSGTWFRDFALSTALVVLPPTIALGITFPASSALMRDESGTEGSETGLLLSVNTLGAIVATFALPFLVIPLIGSPATLAGLALVNAGLGAALCAGARGISPAVRATGGAIGAAALVLVIAALAGGTAFRNPTTQFIEERGGEVFEAAEDEIAAVQAGTLSGYSQLWVGGTSMTILTVDTKFMPLLPVMLRPDADRGLVIAFGMGTTYRTSLAAGVRTDVVELVPSVIDMFRWFYDDAPEVLADPAGEVFVTDGRNFVELTQETYDFVVVDPPPPIESSGVSVISSLEFYRASKARLTPNGVMMQWVPYGQSLDEFLAHVRTFLAVFPNVHVLAGPGGYGFYMLGSDGPVDLDPAVMREVLARPGVMEDVSDAPDARGRSAEDWVAEFGGLSWASGDALRTAVGDGPLVTDDRPLPEYFFLRRLAEPDAPQLTFGGLRELTR